MTTPAMRAETRDPRKFQFDLDPAGRPERAVLANEAWFPMAREVWPHCTSQRRYDPVLDIRTIVIHATAGASSAGAFSVMMDKRASFHWLIPDEDEEGHGRVIWATAPEARACWHVRNTCSHPDIWQGRNHVNHHSLSIEIVNHARPHDPFSDWQIEATAQIIRYAWAKYPNLRHIVSHAKLDPTRRTDPGAHFPWERLQFATLHGAMPKSPRQKSPRAPSRKRAAAGK